MKDVVESSQVTFEEEGVEASVLAELRDVSQSSPMARHLLRIFLRSLSADCIILSTFMMFWKR